MARAPSFGGCRTVSAIHQELIKLLSCDYLVEGNDGARTFFIRSWEYLKTPKDKQKEKVEDVLEALRANGLFAEGNYEVLKKLTRGIDDEIKHLITEAEEKIENIKKETTPLQKRTDIDRGLQVRIDALFDMQKKGEAVVFAVFQWTLDNSDTTDVENLNNCSDFEQMVTDLITICCTSYPEEQLSSYGKKIFSSCIESAEKSFKAGREHFQQFKEHKLPVLKKYITTSGQNWRKTFSGFDAKATSVVCRCVYLDLNFTSVIGLERFWHYYTKRQFERDINNCFNSSIVLELLNVDRLDFTVCITDIEYRNYHEYLVLQTLAQRTRLIEDDDDISSTKDDIRTSGTSEKVIDENMPLYLAANVIFTKIMQDVTTVFLPIKDLWRDLQSNQQRCIPSLYLQKIQHACLSESGYKDFAFTDLYGLLLTFANIPSPSEGWGRIPKSTDINIGDDLERMRNIRLSTSSTMLGFPPKMENYEMVMNEIKTICNRMGARLGNDYVSDLHSNLLYTTTGIPRHDQSDIINYVVLMQGIFGPGRNILCGLLSTCCSPEQLPFHFKDDDEIFGSQRFTELIKDAPTSGYAHFDITTLYMVLRSISKYLTPTRGWGKSPLLHDKAPGDDIERILKMRNDFAELANFDITYEAFNEKWLQLKEIALRIGTKLGKDYVAELNKIEEYNLEEFEAEDFIAKKILKNADSLLNLSIRFFKRNIKMSDIPGLTIPTSLQEQMTAKFKSPFF